jgi:hypothetical protein
VDVERVLAPDVLPELADGLHEWQALDVAHRAADLDQHDVHVGRHRADGVLDLVGDVRDHLDGAPQVVAAPFLLDDRQVDLAGRPVAVARRQLVGEPLVMPEIQVGFGPVVSDVDLTVLKRAHGARIHVDIGVELLQATVYPWPSSSAPIEAAASPLPSDETTPPVTRMYLTGRLRTGGSVGSGLLGIRATRT